MSEYYSKSCVVRNQKDIDRLWPYNKDKYPPPKPKRFPCVARVTDHEGGLGGSWTDITFEYCPKGLDFRSWAIGVTGKHYE